MSTEVVREALLWCAVINYGVLMVWFGLFCCARPGLYRLHTRWFQLNPDQFDRIHYLAMAVYKLGIVLLNLAPYAALHIVGP